MDLELSGQRTVIVGGARGIGRAIAERFAREGCELALIDRDASVEQTARELSGRAWQADVTDWPAIQECAQSIGRCDHLVFAVAIGSGKFGFPFWNLSPADWDRVLRINIIGAVNIAHAFAPMFVEARRGSLVFLASVAGQMGSQTDPPYSASKAALINFAQCAAKDFAPFGVRVNTICPGMVQTELNRSVWAAWAATQSPETWQSYEDWAGEKIRKVVPLGRWQTPDDIAAMAVFLASARAVNITGQTINVDGGFVMHW